MKYIIDTNGLINNPHIMEDKDVIVTSIVLRELEKLELKKMDRVLQYSIRVAKRVVEEKLNSKSIDIIDIDHVGVHDGYVEGYADNVIVKYATMNEDTGIITDDILLKHKAISMGVEVIPSSDQEDEIQYKGFKEEMVGEEFYKEIYSNLSNNVFNLLRNQYVLLKDTDEEFLDVLVWTGTWMESIYTPTKSTNVMKPIKSIARNSQFEKVMAKDPYQAMAIDSLDRNQVTMVRGRAGSGKSMLALYSSWNIVERNDGRLVIFFNPAPSKDSITMGFNKGDLVEKAMASSLGAMLKSKFGDEDMVKHYIDRGKIEILPFTDLRGWDSTSEQETVVLISEAQNLTSELMKMGLQRIGDGTKVIIDGDYNQQIDRDAYLYSNGMKRASEVLKGHRLYGEVELQNVYRGEIASAVDEM